MTLRVLVLVLSVDREPWRSIETDGQRSTWAAPSMHDQSATVVFYQGRTNGLARIGIAAFARLHRRFGRTDGRILITRLRDGLFRRLGNHYQSALSWTDGDIIRTEVPETYDMVTVKTFVAFRHALSTMDFDYLLRTNTSSYVDRESLLTYVENLPRSQYWGGAITYSDGDTFTSGANTLLSRDVVATSLKSEWDWAMIDDRALGRVLNERGLEPEAIERPDVMTPDAASRTNLDAFVWRCKGMDERNDASTMRALHAELERHRS